MSHQSFFFCVSSLIVELMLFFFAWVDNYFWIIFLPRCMPTISLFAFLWMMILCWWSLFKVEFKVSVWRVNVYVYILYVSDYIDCISNLQKYQFRQRFHQLLVEIANLKQEYTTWKSEFRNYVQKHDIYNIPTLEWCRHGVWIFISL